MTILDVKTWTLAERLKRARLVAGLEQAELSELIGASRASISNYENGRTEPTASTFVLWAEATGASLEWLAQGVVRPEGFEPPAYCSVAGLAALCPCEADHESPYEPCYCSCHGHRDEWNRPCPVCGAPIVWGVCVAPHDAAPIVWELAA